MTTCRRAIFREVETKQHVIRAVSDRRRSVPSAAGGSMHARLSSAPTGDSLSVTTETAGGPVEVWNIDRLRNPADPTRSTWRSLGHQLSTGQPRARPGIDGWDLHDLGSSDRRRDSSIALARRAPGMFVALHPNEPLIACCSYFHADVAARLPHRGKSFRRSTRHGRWARSSLAWHPDGRRLFVAAGDTNEVQEYRFDPTRENVDDSPRAARPPPRPWWHPRLHQPCRRSTCDLGLGMCACSSGPGDRTDAFPVPAA